MLHILNSQNTILNKFVAEIRDKSIQKDSMRFRRNLERIGEVMAYEISKTFEYAVKVVETPLGEASVAMISDQVVIATILRAGLPFHQGFLNYFDDAQNAFVSAYRSRRRPGLSGPQRQKTVKQRSKAGFDGLFLCVFRSITIQ